MARIREKGTNSVGGVITHTLFYFVPGTAVSALPYRDIAAVGQDFSLY